MQNIIMYLRKSRSDGEGGVEEVLGRHEKILQEFYQKNYGTSLPDTQIYREIRSGETISDRPVMQYIMTLVEEAKTDGVLVLEPQRLSRGDLADTGRLSRLFMYTGVPIITPQKTYNLADKFDRKFFEMELMRGNDYLEYTKEILRRGRLASVKEGNYIGSVPPYGYDKVSIDGKPTLAINQREGEVVRLIFDLCARGFALREIANRLNEGKITPRRAAQWDRGTLRDILNNPVYSGFIRWNRRQVKKVYRRGEIAETRPKNHDALLVKGRHTAIISEDLFNLCRERLEEYRKGTLPPQTPVGHRQNPLHGLLFCRCGSNMVLKNGTYLTCSGKCGCRGASLERVMSLIEEKIYQMGAKEKWEKIHQYFAASTEKGNGVNAVIREYADWVEYYRVRSPHGRWEDTDIEITFHQAVSPPS